MKFMENMKRERKDNRGFSLVELIIVIAIMAILVGIVGTQVIPYLNRSRESKDLQLLNSYSTAAVSAYSMNVDKLSSATATITIANVYDTTLTGDAKIVADEIIQLVGYDKITGGTNNLKDKMGSTAGKNITAIKVVINPSTGEVTVDGVDATGASTGLDQVKSYI